jgi:hypothetical protein
VNSKIILFLGLLGASLVFLVIAIVLPGNTLTYIIKLILLLLAVIADVTAFTSRRYSYLILPLLRQRSRNVVLSNEEPYRLSSSSDSILQQNGDMFTATVYVSIPLYSSSTEMGDAEKLAFTKQVSRLVGISKDPTRYSVGLHIMNKDTYIQQLRDTINNVESDESKLVQSSAPQAEIERVRGKLSMWRKMLEHVSSTTSLELASFASISAVGSKEFEAATIAQQKARELMAGIGATLGVSPSIVTGADLLTFIEPEYLIPYSTVSEQISRGIQEQVI